MNKPQSVTVSGAGGSPLKTRVKELLKRAGVR